jgi:hypothetical protein
MALIYLIAYLYAFWCVYIGVMGIYRAHLDGRLSGVTKVLCYPFVFVGIVMDVVANLLIAPIVFLDLPREWLVTDRLIRYIKTDNDWRRQVAEAVCANLLDVFDPTGRHCK